MFTKVQMTQLPNGLRVISSSIDHFQSVSMGIWLNVGSRYETVAQGGASHFLEHLLFKGTPRRSALQISQDIEGRGGYLNAFTQEESTCYFAQCGFDRLKPSFDVLADMVLNATCSAEDVEKERHVILEEMLMYRDQPHQYVMELLQEAVWPGHPMGRPVIGCEKSVGAMTAADIQAFKAQKYVPATMVLAFAGAIKHEQCVALAESYFSGMPAGRAPKAVRFEASRRQERVNGITREIEQTHLALGIRTFGLHDPQRHAIRVLNTVLGENMSSRLFQVVRERYGLAYSIQSSVQLHDDTGMLQISAGLDRQRSTKALDLILKELDRFRFKPIGAGELRRAKDYMVGQLRLGLEGSSNQMMWLGNNVLSYGRFIDPAEAMAEIQRVTAEDVRELAASCFDKSRMTIALVSPPNDRLTTELAAASIDQF
ncbi:MAG TPA: peptidase M16 [Verrucomicrobia bacterium]|nr:peptidase M16 [Verrucomicrobiota bacterium]